MNHNSDKTDKTDKKTEEEKIRNFKLVTFEFFSNEELNIIKKLAADIQKTPYLNDKNLYPVIEFREFENEIKSTFNSSVFNEPCFSEVYTLLLSHYVTIRRMIINEIENSSNTKKTIIFDDGLATKMFLFSSLDAIDEYELYKNIEFAYLGIYPDVSFFKDPELFKYEIEKIGNKNMSPEDKDMYDIDYKKIKEKIESYFKIYEKEGKTKCFMINKSLDDSGVCNFISQELKKIVYF